MKDSSLRCSLSNESSQQSRPQINIDATKIAQHREP